MCMHDSVQQVVPHQLCLLISPSSCSLSHQHMIMEGLVPLEVTAQELVHLEATVCAHLCTTGRTTLSQAGNCMPDTESWVCSLNLTGRTYHYRIQAGATAPSIFERGCVWHVPTPLNISLMQVSTLNAVLALIQDHCLLVLRSMSNG